MASELVIIDVNFFPSYKEVADFPQKFRAFLAAKAAEAAISRDVEEEVEDEGHNIMEESTRWAK